MTPHLAAIRLRPVVDLLMRVPVFDDGAIVDLGCGTGMAAPILRTRFPKARIIGVDPDPARLAEAWKTGAYDGLDECAIADWRPRSAPRLIFSSDALQNCAGHATLLPALVGRLAPGGILAAELPHHAHAPAIRLWHDLIAQQLPGRLDGVASPDNPDARTTFDTLEPHGTLALWETEYFHRLPADPQVHPVRTVTAPAAAPLLARLDADEQAMITRAYDQAMAAAYPSRPDGSVLLPLRRLFYILTRP